jgi:hypothetical protein
MVRREALSLQSTSRAAGASGELAARRSFQKSFIDASSTALTVQHPPLAKWPHIVPSRNHSSMFPSEYQAASLIGRNSRRWAGFEDVVRGNYGLSPRAIGRTTHAPPPGQNRQCPRDPEAASR